MCRFLLAAWLSSGKVHGSLARAGKVRGQTPKQAKTDKPKNARGRAYKRMQYNRRFVTADKGSFEAHASYLRHAFDGVTKVIQLAEWCIAEIVLVEDRGPGSRQWCTNSSE
ncbi:hypothetical protein GW17_00061582, partial [Ensete ventricosum]